MTHFIVTIKLPKNRKHDPHNKITEECPFSEECTDSTGEHHSFLRSGFEDSEEVREHFKNQGLHVTRVEMVDNEQLS